MHLVLTSKQLESTLLAAKYTSNDFPRVDSDSQRQVIGAVPKCRRQIFNDLVQLGHTVMSELGHNDSMIRLSIGQTGLGKQQQ